MNIITRGQAHQYILDIEAGKKQPNPNTAGFYRESMIEYVAFKGDFEIQSFPNKELAASFAFNK